MKYLYTYFTLTVCTIFGIMNLNSQELHNHSNAASITSEADSTDGWGGNTTNTSVTNESHSGSYSIKVEAPSNGWSSAEYSFSTTPGQLYQIKLWAKSDSPNIPEVHWREFDNEGYLLIGTEWSEFVITETAASAIAKILVYTGVPATTGNTVYIDHVSITAVSSGSDTQDPTAPTLSNTGQSQTTADLSWSGATDNTAVTGYKIFKDGALEATLGNVSTYQVTNLTASTTYGFTATAIDAAGNESVTSNTVPITTDALSGGGSSAWSENGTALSHTGEVAIGTSSVPSGYKLAVDGNIRTREIRVDQDSWPDYVFEEGYELPSLEEIEKHIDEKGHLPNIPSAKEVEENGIEVGEMNRLLLEKIEELTLYIIQLEKENKRIDALEDEQKILKQNMKDLKMIIKTYKNEKK